MRNAEASIDSWIGAVELFADAVIALDDGSTDNTSDRLAVHPLVKVLLRNPVRPSFLGWDDARNRQRLVDAIETLSLPNPDQVIWTIQLDADERIPPDDALALREAITTQADSRFAYLLRCYRMIDDDQHFDRRENWAGRMFAYRPGIRLPTNALHFTPLPTDISPVSYRKTTIRIQHFANVTPALRSARFAKYVEVDPDNQHQKSYDHLRDQPTELHAWPARLAELPFDLHGLAPEVAPNSFTSPRVAFIHRFGPNTHARSLMLDLKGLDADVVVIVEAPLALNEHSAEAMRLMGLNKAMGVVAGPAWEHRGQRASRLLERSLLRDGAPFDDEWIGRRPPRCNVFRLKSLLAVLELQPTLSRLEDVTDALWAYGYGAEPILGVWFDRDNSRISTGNFLSSARRNGQERARHILEQHEEYGTLGAVPPSVFGLRPGLRSFRALVSVINCRRRESGAASFVNALRAAATRLAYMPVVITMVAIEQLSGRRTIRRERGALSHRVRT